LLNLLIRNLVIPPHYNLLPKLAKILDQVISKGIVVIEDEDHLAF
jgi:hypothetical protein